MTFKQFSTELILTDDLDPDYVFLRKIFEEQNFSLAQKVYWFAHKIFIYDTASEYKHILGGVPIAELKFGAERAKSRHSAEKNILRFIRDFSLHHMPREYTEAAKFLKLHDGVGDWAAWKFCDLLERVADVSIDFSKTDFRVAYEYPLRGLAQIAGMHEDDHPLFFKDQELYHRAMTTAWKEFPTGLHAPPTGNRRVNIQEFETCLCKYHSFLSGHYYIGKDTKHLTARFVFEGIPVPVNLLANHIHITPLNL